ncbi:hypothetical protein AB0J38_01730 [Streptomyces sp. NPDC050095]|uniref:hypothetical protein n=1 Tax=unclassified Streptomyces TaxID=2593676 RepID=UPI003426BF1C
MGFIRIFEDPAERSGWFSVWDAREPTGVGWEAVFKNNPAVLVVLLDGEQKGRVVARNHNGVLQADWPYQGELLVGTQRVKVGRSSLSPHRPAEVVAKSCSTGVLVPLDGHEMKMPARR